jgi:hypothetical protein
MLLEYFRCLTLCFPSGDATGALAGNPLPFLSFWRHCTKTLTSLQNRLEHSRLRQSVILMVGCRNDDVVLDCCDMPNPHLRSCSTTVAATGIPKSQVDHATRMARFAYQVSSFLDTTTVD